LYNKLYTVAIQKAIAAALPEGPGTFRTKTGMRKLVKEHFDRKDLLPTSGKSALILCRSKKK